MSTIKLRCISCGYKFVPKVKIPKRCPYCSALNTIRREDTAASLIKEVGNE